MPKIETRGRKKIKDRFIINEHLDTQLVSIKMLSLLLTDKEFNLRADKPIPEKYREHVEKLILFVKDWIEETKKIKAKKNESSTY